MSGVCIRVKFEGALMMSMSFLVEMLNINLGVVNLLFLFLLS
jgi:hypothetical protein